MLDIILDVVEPCSLAGTPVLSKHTDSDVGEVTLLNIGRAGKSNLRTGPVCSVGIGAEGKATLNRFGIGRDRATNVDAT